MKTVSTALAAILLMAGCTPAEKFLRTDPGEITVGALDLSDIPLTVSSSASWMVDLGTSLVSDEQWLGFSYDTGNPALLWVGIEQRNESPEPRTASITLVSGDGLVTIIPVTQRALEASFAVAPRAVEPFGARDDLERTLAVESNLAWEYWPIGGEWITATPGEGTISLVAATSRSLDVRRDTVVVRPVNENFHHLADSIAIHQRGLDLMIASEALNDASWELEIPAEGGEIEISVESRDGWILATDAAPERVAIDLTEGPADVDGTPVVITVAPNPDPEHYTFTLTFTCAGQTYEYKCIQQSGERPPEPDPEPEQPQPEPEQPEPTPEEET